MAKAEHVAKLKEGVEIWNTWRGQNRGIQPDLWEADLRKVVLLGAHLSGANLRGANLCRVDLHGAYLGGAVLYGAILCEANLNGVNLRRAYLRKTNLREAYLGRTNLRGADFDGADLSKANLEGADLHGANFRGANLDRANLCEANLYTANFRGADLRGVNFRAVNLRGADLRGANLSEVDLHRAVLEEVNLGGANLSGANLVEADFRGVNFVQADLSGADLSGVNLYVVNLTMANLSGTNFTHARLVETTFANVDLTDAKGLESCVHRGPSTIDYRTLEQSGKLPLAFLRGCGLPDTFIDYLPSLLNQPIQHYSCFISYSSKDEMLAQRLHADLQDKGVRCWFAPEDLKIGDKIRTRIDEAIRTYEKLLLLLSAHSVASGWVEKEVETAFDKEIKRKEPVLFPIRLDAAVMESETGWAADIRRSRHIGDFSNWKNHDEYQKGLERLLRDLKIEKGE